MYSRNIKLLSLFNFLLGFSFFAPLAIIYFSNVSGSYILGASVFGIIMLASALFEVPTGILSDRVGRRKTIILGSCARVLSFVLYAIGLSYWVLVVGAIFEGLSRAFYSGNNNAFLYDTLADSNLKNEYDEMLGKTNSTEQLAYGLSALIGSFIAAQSFSLLVWIAVLPQIAMLIVSLYFIEPKTHIRESGNVFSHIKTATKLFIHNPKLRLLSMASMISFATSELTYQFRSAFFATVWPVWAIGFSNILSNIGASLSFYFSGKILKRISEVNMLLFRSVYGKVVTFIGLLLPSWFSPIIMSTVSFLYGAGEVAENKLMQQEFSNSERATMSSLNSLGGSIAFALMSLVLGGLADTLGPALGMVIMTILSLPVTYIYWVMFKGEKRKSVTPEGIEPSLVG